MIHEKDNMNINEREIREFLFNVKSGLVDFDSAVEKLNRQLTQQNEKRIREEEKIKVLDYVRSTLESIYPSANPKMNEVFMERVSKMYQYFEEHKEISQPNNNTQNKNTKTTNELDLKENK